MGAEATQFAAQTDKMQLTIEIRLVWMSVLITCL